MSFTFLHVSDFHIRTDRYEQDLVLGALIQSVAGFREVGHAPNAVFATGDIAFAGKPDQYETATRFFDDLLRALDLPRERLFVIPGNHDVDRDLSAGLSRTLATREDADAYFDPLVPKHHLLQKMGAFVQWHDRYFGGIRSWPRDTTCGPIDVIRADTLSVAVLPVNSALFCLGDDDHGQLFVGRRCLAAAREALVSHDADLRIGLIHHPFDWLSDVERGNVKTALQGAVDIVLSGHLHQSDVEGVTGGSGSVLRLAAGASYDTRKWPNRALYATVDGDSIRIFPIRYEDSPTEIWTVDPTLFPDEPGYEGRMPLDRSSRAPAPPHRASPAPPASGPPRLRTNIQSRGNLPFVGRDALLKALAAELADPLTERVVVLLGAPGTGKSELAREFARRHRARYPGGTFFVPWSGGNELVELSRIGSNMLGLDYPGDAGLEDMAMRTFVSLGTEPVLLVYDNPPSSEAIRPWLPVSGMPCHVIVTTIAEMPDLDWTSIPVQALDDEASLDLVRQLAGDEVAERFGASLTAMAGGLPVQIVPACRALAVALRRGRLGSARIELAAETRSSFGLVYETLDADVRLVLHAALLHDTDRIVLAELRRNVADAADFDRAVGVARDLLLLDGEGEMRMHQLFASFLLEIERASRA